MGQNPHFDLPPPQAETGIAHRAIDAAVQAVRKEKPKPLPVDPHYFDRHSEAGVPSKG